MSKVSINALADYAKRLDAKPSPSDKFTLTLTRSHLQWLQWVVDIQVRTEKAQLEYYVKRDAAKHPERHTIAKFNKRLELAQDFASALDKAMRV